MRGLITASLKDFWTYPNDNDELIIFRRRSITSGSISFRSLDGTGSNLQVVDLDDLNVYTILHYQWKRMNGIVPQGIYSILFDAILWLTAAWLQFYL